MAETRVLPEGARQDAAARHGLQRRDADSPKTASRTGKHVMLDSASRVGEPTNTPARRGDKHATRCARSRPQLRATTRDAYLDGVRRTQREMGDRRGAYVRTTGQAVQTNGRPIPVGMRESVHNSGEREQVGDEMRVQKGHEGHGNLKGKTTRLDCSSRVKRGLSKGKERMEVRSATDGAYRRAARARKDPRAVKRTRKHGIGQQNKDSGSRAFPPAT